MPRERLLILCKTYPSPSAKYVETSCVAALRQDGGLVRLYPVPFRLIGDSQQFKKWQWVEAELKKAPDDHRPESHRLRVDTIACGATIPTSGQWSQRREAIQSEQVFTDFGNVEVERQLTGKTLSLLRPARILDLEITEAGEPSWTEDEIEKLLQQQRQPGLFDATDAPALRTLKNLPFAFHYRYECTAEGGSAIYRHKIVDWEAGALFWNCRRRYGEHWRTPFRAKLLEEMQQKDLLFLMGTIHRFPDKWLIVSLLYPPHHTGPTQQRLI